MERCRLGVKTKAVILVKDKATGLYKLDVDGHTLLLKKEEVIGHIKSNFIK